MEHRFTWRYDQTERMFSTLSVVPRIRYAVLTLSASFR